MYRALRPLVHAGSAVFILSIISIISGASWSTAAAEREVCSNHGVRVALGTLAPVSVPTTPAQSQQLQQVVLGFRSGRQAEARQAWAAFSAAYFTRANRGTLPTVVRAVLREIVGGTPGMPDGLARLSAACQRSQQAQDVARRLTAARGELQGAVSRLRAAPPGTTARIRPVEVQQTATAARLVRGPEQPVSVAGAEAALARLDAQLKAATDGAQAAQFDLQKVYQDYQQAVATLAGIQKQVHDDAMKIIGNLK
jgi:hypothetical protein